MLSSRPNNFVAANSHNASHTSTLGTSYNHQSSRSQHQPTPSSEDGNTNTVKEDEPRTLPKFYNSTGRLVEVIGQPGAPYQGVNERTTNINAFSMTLERRRELDALSPLHLLAELAAEMPRMPVPSESQSTVSAFSSSTPASPPPKNSKSRASKSTKQKTAGRKNMSKVTRVAKKRPTGTRKDMNGEKAANGKPTSESSSDLGKSLPMVTSNGRVLKIPRRFWDS